MPEHDCAYRRAWIAHWAYRSHLDGCRRCKADDSDFCPEGERLHKADLDGFSAALAAYGNEPDGGDGDARLRR